ncbi:MAG: hypothetical protein AAFQ96_06865, partial [Pseudomonadota bacterium]
MSTPITEDAAIAERLAPPDLTGDEGEARPRTDDARPIAGPMKRLTRRPLLPEAGAGGLPLTAVIAIMSFLAVLALAGFLAIAAASSAWTDELKSAFTVQIKGPDAETIEARTKEAARILSTTPGVLDAAVIESDEAAKLLEPWLGGGDVEAAQAIVDPGKQSRGGAPTPADVPPQAAEVFDELYAAIDGGIQ